MTTTSQGDNPQAVPVSQRRRIVIQPRRGWFSLELRELWRHREMLHFLVWRDLAVRYKQTVLGFVWAFLQPFVKLVVFSAVFGGLAKFDSEGQYYPIFLYAGLLPWHFFSQSLSRCSDSLVSNNHLISRVYFPRLILPLSAIGGSLVDFAISFVILIGMMIFYQKIPGPEVLMIIPLVLATIVAALSVGTIISAANVAYRDFRLLVPFLIQIWMFLTPVVYSTGQVPESLRWLLAVNPMTGIIDGYRWALLGTPMNWGGLALSTVVTLALLLAGTVYFRRVERYFADII